VITCPTIAMNFSGFPMDIEIPVGYLTGVSPLVGFQEWLDKENLGFICQKK